jgi:hypothetical protein
MYTSSQGAIERTYPSMLVFHGYSVKAYKMKIRMRNTKYQILPTSLLGIVLWRGKLIYRSQPVVRSVT